MRVIKKYSTILLAGIFLTPVIVQAQVIQGPADVGRIRPEERLPENDNINDSIGPPPVSEKTSTVPDSIKKVRIVLQQLNIEGMTIYRPQDMAEFYSQYIKKDVSLDVLWTIADKITTYYRNNGYFLTRAYVPQQDIRNGIATIKVVEGYIGKVEIDDTANNRIVESYIKNITSKKPIKDSEVESFLLGINNLPGMAYRAVLTEWKESNDEAAGKIVLVAIPRGNKGTISADNYGSRFLGPNEATATYSMSFIPLQETTVSVSSSMPADELRYGAIRHKIALSQNMSLELNASKTNAYPGYNLKAFEIESDSVFFGADLNYQLIRQRNENLQFKFGVGSRNVNTDLLSTVLVSDDIRTLHGSVTYDVTDHWGGSDNLNLTLTQGLDVLGASDKGDINLSRAAAEPDFTKVELQIARLQRINNYWSVLATLSGQMSSHALFSSEEFGYGGQSFGRAFDASEITGDSGIEGALELNYNAWYDLRPVGLMPYVFYDIGTVWNRDIGQGNQSGSSVGFGTKIKLPMKFYGNIGLAFPLRRDIATPVYGENDSGPRILLQISHEF